jgi:hypothetical protein
VGIIGVSNDPGHVGAGRLGDCIEFQRIPAGNRPFDSLTVSAVAIDEVLTKDLTNEARCSKDHNVMLALRCHSPNRTHIAVDRPIVVVNCR